MSADATTGARAGRFASGRTGHSLPSRLARADGPRPLAAIELRWRITSAAAMDRIPELAHLSTGDKPVVLAVRLSHPDHPAADNPSARWDLDAACATSTDHTLSIDPSALGLEPRCNPSLDHLPCDRLSIQVPGLGSISLALDQHHAWRARYVRVPMIERFGGGCYELDSVRVMPRTARISPS